MTIAMCGHAASKVISHKVTRAVIPSVVRNRQGLSLALKEDHQIGHTAMIDVAVGFSRAPFPLSRIRRKILRHIFMNFLLQINADCAIRADDFVGTHARVSGNIATRIRNVNVGGVIANRMMSTLNRSVHQLLEKQLPVCRVRRAGGQRTVRPRKPFPKERRRTRRARKIRT